MVSNRKQWLQTDMDHKRPFGRGTMCRSCQYPQYRDPWRDTLHCQNRDCAEYNPRPRVRKALAAGPVLW